MKKILIALPLVLVMLLSMVPVMAEEMVSLSVSYEVWVTTIKADGTKSTPEVKQYTEPLSVRKASVDKAKVDNNDIDDLKADVLAALKGKYAPKTAAGGEYYFNFLGFKFEPAKEAETSGDEVLDPGHPDRAVGLVIEKDCSDVEVPEEPCKKTCEFITVSLNDVYSGKDLSAYTKKIRVKANTAPEYQAVVELYLNNYFPWKSWQPVKNFLNMDSIHFPKTIHDCEIVIDVIPQYVDLMIIHEMWDCCITPDGEKKYELSHSFIEDNQRFAIFAIGSAYNVKTGVPDGVVQMGFLEFHNGLAVNPEKAQEYAKTRIEKMNAKGFVFQEAKLHLDLPIGQYLTGEVYDLNGKLVDKFTQGIPTIVLKYYRAECVDKAEEKVDDAKVEAGVQTTTNAPAQQLPATGAKDVTAFFMSAVALLGLGIFFAKKH